MYQALVLIGLLSTSLMASAMTDAELAKALRSDFDSCVTTSKIPRYVFHWTDASDITPQGQFSQSFDPTSPMFAQYFQKHGPAIIRQRDEHDIDMAGPGVYLANDSAATRNYGGQKNFGLIVGQIRPGAKILQEGCPAMAAASLAELTARGCEDGKKISDLVATKEPRCLKIKQLLFGANLDLVQGLVYNYINGNILGCGPSRNAIADLNFKPGIDAKSMTDYGGVGETFVAYSPQLFSKVFGFTNRTLPSKDPQAKELLSYFKTIQQQAQLLQPAQAQTMASFLQNGSGSTSAYIGSYLNSKMSTFTSPEVFADPKIPFMSEAEMKKFNQKYIFGCVPVN